MNITIGKRIQSLRKHHALSQQALAEKLGVSRQTIGKWESDLSLPDLEMLIALSQIYDVPLAQMLGIEEQESTNDSISELYDQIQTVTLNLQKQNKQKNIFQIASITLCVLSLILTLAMKIQLDQQDNFYASLIQTEQEAFTTQKAVLDISDVNQPNLQDSYLATADLFGQQKYDLDSWEVYVDYKFSLKEYTPDTQMSIEFVNEYNQSYSYDLTKSNDNYFTLKQRIPLDNYKQAILTIKDGETTRVENLVKTHQCDFLNFVIMNQINLYIPLNEKGTLDLQTVIYDPSFINNIYKNRFTGKLKGEIDVTFYRKSIGTHRSENAFPLDEYTVIQISREKLPVNEPIYITVEITVNKPIKQPGSSYHYLVDFGLSEDQYGKPLYCYFIIDDKTQEYPIFQINQKKD